MARTKEKEKPFAVSLSFAILLFVVLAFKSSVLDANNIPSGSMIPTLKVGDYLFVNKMRYSLRIPFTGIEILRIDEPARGDIVTFVPPGGSANNYVKRVVGVPGDTLRIRSVGACDLRPTLENREFNCELPFLKFLEPRIALVEFQARGSSVWETYSPEEMLAGESRKELLDADDAQVLYPEMIPDAWHADSVPVLFTETVTGRAGHFTVEKNLESPVYNRICPTIETSGCKLGEDQYMVMGDNRDNSQDSRVFGLVNRHDILGKALFIYFSINWYDGICQRYMENQARYPVAGGFLLPAFPPEKQKEYCHSGDLFAMDSIFQAIPRYLYNTVFFRLPRMKVRWGRIGSILN